MLATVQAHSVARTRDGARSAYRVPDLGRYQGVGDFLNWIALVGAGLIVGGLVLLTSAITGAGRARRARRARRSARPAESAAYRRADPRRADPRRADPRRADPRLVNRTRGAQTQRRPDIRRSALLAETVPLAQVPQPPPVGALQGPTLPLITVDWNYAGRPPR